MTIPVVLVAAVATSSIAGPVIADTRSGYDKYNRGDFFGAVQDWRAAAIAGDPIAQYDMGQAYKFGRGVPKDLKLAQSWYGKAAAQGLVEARDKFGLMLFTNGDRIAAMPYIEEAAGRGDPAAQYVLATALFNGDGIPKDWVRAYALMTRSSASGLIPASTSLSQMDKFIPVDQRRRGLALAQTYDRAAAPKQTAENLAGDNPPPPSRIAREELPASTVGALPPAPSAARGARPRVVTARPAVRPGLPNAAPTAVKGTHWAETEEAPPPMKRLAQSPPAAPQGQWKVQLAAFGDNGKADALWVALRQRISALGPYRAIVMRAGPVTRLQAGPLASREAAGKLCIAVKSANQPCIPVAP